jgi:hypothetical protein
MIGNGKSNVMSKECLDREKLYMDFVDECGKNVSISGKANVFEKGLFVRLCASQQTVKRVFFSGYEDSLLKASKKGGAYFFSEIISLELKIPRIIALIIFKIKCITSLIMTLARGMSNTTIANCKKFDDRAILISAFDRLTQRFIKHIDEYNHLFEVNASGVVNVYDQGLYKKYSFYLPRVTVKQFIFILLSPAWQSSFLTQAFRLKNCIHILEVKEVYVMDGDAPNHVSAAYAASLASIPSIGVQWGGMPIGVKPGYKTFPFDFFYCTGKFYSDLLSPFSPHTKFSVKPRIKEIARNEHLNNRANSLLFLFEDSPTIITKKESHELIEICIATKQRYPDLNITARPHPRMILADSIIDKLIALDVFVDRVQDADEAMASNKYIIGHVSSMMIESLEYDCLPVFYDIGIVNMQPELIKLSAAKIFKNKHEWFLILDELIQDYADYIPPAELKFTLFGRN